MRWLLLFLALYILPVKAMQQISVRDQERAEVSISSTDVNRIALVNDRIKAIYGGQDQATFTTDEETGQVFITTKKPTLFGISLITEKGFTIDLNLKPSESTSETILLTVNPDEREIETLTTEALKPLSKKALKGCKYLTTYFGLKYKAIVFLYTNNQGEPITLTEAMFSNEHVFIENKSLKPKGATRIILFETYA